MSARLRIVHAIRSDAFAGVERHVAGLAAAQHDAGHQVAVIGGDPALMRGAIDRERVLHRAVPNTTVATARAIDSLARCDVVHVHMTAAEVAALLAFRACGVPVVSTRHFAGRRGSAPITRSAARVVAHRITAQVAISRFVAEHVDGASTVIYPGVAVRRDAAPAADRERIVLVAQRLETEKRSDVALAAFAGSGLTAAGWRLVVAGDGAQRHALEALAARLGIAEATSFLGHRPDVQELMGRAGLLLAPCPVEGLGLTVMEAMAVGLPVVAARAGGHLETLGLVADSALYAPEDAAEAGILLAALAGSTPRRDSYGRAMQDVQRDRFTLSAQSRAIEDLYRSLL